MNIHFKDIELFEKLKKATILKTIFGSKLYGIDDINSDIDYLYIYVPSISERNTFYPSHHHLQYKEKNNNIDHIFVNIFTFLKNCINGDSPIFFEIINHDSILNSPLNFLYDMRKSFYNYKIIRSYNGIAKRDIKELSKQISEHDKNKKLAHVLRGHEFSKMIYNLDFNPIINSELKEEIFKIKNISDWKVRKEITEKLQLEVENFRKKLTDDYNNKFSLPKFMLVEDQIKLDVKLSELINSDIWKEKLNWYMDLKEFYIANENTEINYNL